MTRKVSDEELMRYLDDELEPADHARIRALVENSTELQRELAIWRSIRDGVADLSFAPRPRGTTVWDGVNRRLGRPVGWVLLTVGALVFLVYSAVVYATSDSNPWEKIGVGALAIGFVVLLGSTAYERAKEWRTDPYRDVHR